MLRVLMTVLLICGFLFFAFPELQKAGSHVDISRIEDICRPISDRLRCFVREQKARFFPGEGNGDEHLEEGEEEAVPLGEVLKEKRERVVPPHPAPVPDKANPEMKKEKQPLPERKPLIYAEKMRLLQEARESLARALKVLEADDE